MKKIDFQDLKVKKTKPPRFPHTRIVAMVKNEDHDLHQSCHCCSLDSEYAARCIVRTSRFIVASSSSSSSRGGETVGKPKRREVSLSSRKEKKKKLLVRWHLCQVPKSNTTTACKKLHRRVARGTFV
jgi:hypothetical protein